VVFFNAYDVMKEGGYIALGFVGGVDMVLDAYELGRSLMNHDWTGAAFAAVVLVIPCVGASYPLHPREREMMEASMSFVWQWIGMGCP